MLLNKLQLYLMASQPFRQTGKDNMVQMLARYKRYSFMVTESPILPIYPKPIVDICKYAFVDEHPLDRTLDLSNIKPVNVGTVGHIDYWNRDFDTIRF
jgi:hypothetical protein